MTNPTAHKDVKGTDMHAIVRWTVANINERDRIPVYYHDVHKVAYLTETSEYYVLVDNLPKTWVLLSRPSDLAGLPFNIVDPQENEVLQVRSSTWRNVPQTDLTDGGNF